MVTKELSEAAVEFNCILKNASKDVREKIPSEFITFLKSIESKTYKFKYDKRKSLKEQELKLETRGLIALVYQDYLCDEEKKKQYLKKCSERMLKKELEKREKYNPDDLFKSRRTNQSQENVKEENLDITVQEKDSWFKKVFSKLKKFFTNKR